MSFILEALVQAQLERQSRGIPSVHTVQTLPRRRPQPRRRWPAVSAGLGATSALLAIAWMQLGQPPVRQVSAPIITSASIAAPSAPSGPAVVSLGRTGLAPAAPLQQLQQATAEAGRPVATPVEARRKPARKVRKGKTRTSAARIAAVPGRLYGISELPAELRTVARNISIAGFAHSDNPKERMAIINNRALREGEEVSGGLRVERIAGDGVVFNLRGYRFRKGRT